MLIESEEILSKISDLINSKIDELTTNLNNFRQEASNNNQTLENAIGSIKSVIDEKLSKIDQISSEINSIQTSVQSVADTVSATNNKIDNISSQQTQLQRTVDSVSRNIEKLSTVTSNQLTYLSNQSQNITEKVDKLSLQQEREARTAAVEGARGTVVVDPATGKTVSGVAAADATGDGEETKQSLIGSVLSGIKGILTSPLALGGAALGAAALGTAAALRKEPPETPQAGSDAEFNLSPDTSGSRRTGGQTGQPLTGRVMTGGATAPKNLSEDTLKALNEVARENNLDPSAISMMIDTESKWKTSTRSPSGTYRGLTQIGRQTFKEAGGRLGGLTWQQYQNASPADQIRVYGSWLKHYKFQDKLKRNDVNLSELPPNLQAAYLQGFQFAPNAESWQRQFGKGNYGVRTTRTRQARALGTTSINDMARYYGQKAKRYPPVFEKRESGVEQRPQPDASREQTQEKLTPVDTGPGQEKFGYRGRGSPKGVDPRLMELFKKTAEDFPLRVRFMSGRLGRSSGAHSRGRAGDITIYDDAGNALPNYQNSRTFRIYEIFAQKMRENAKALYPELADNNWKNGELDWGGLFGGAGNNPNKRKYGSADTMDYRINYGDMTRAGSIEGGLNSRYKGSYDKGDIFGGSKAYSPEVLKEDLERLKGFRLNKEQIEDVRKYGFFGVARASGRLPERKYQESTGEASYSGVPGIIVTPPTNLDKVTDPQEATDSGVPGIIVTPPKKPDLEPKPSQRINNEQAQQEKQPPQGPAAGSFRAAQTVPLAGDGFYKDTSPTGPNKSAPPPAQKKLQSSEPDLN